MADLPKVKTLWSVDEKLGGWGMAQPKFFDGGVSFIYIYILLEILQSVWYVCHAPASQSSWPGTYEVLQ